jgi:ammonium transporter, Amt family
MASHQASLSYAECAEANTGSVEGLLICLANHMTQADQVKMEVEHRNALSWRNTYVITCAGMVFFMQAGFAMVCAGAVRRKNLQNTMLKNLLDACGATVAFLTLGYGFAFGKTGNGFIGTSNFFLQGVDDLSFFLYQYSFSAAAATIVAGALAERCQMQAYFYYSMILTGFVYPVVVHCIWSDDGFLSGFNNNPLFGVGVLDTAGSGVIHITSGFTR